MGMLAAKTTAHRRLVLAGIIGNVLEWYDFAVYGYSAAVVARLFFPASDPTASLLAAFGVFGVGFLMRPLGGVLFGYIGDRFGRMSALRWSVAAMALPTFAIGLLPTYASAISVSDTGLPTGATGTFTSTSVTIAGSSPATTTLNIKTTARPVNTGSLLRGGPLYATWLPVGGLSLVGLGLGAVFKRRRWLARMLLGLLTGLIILQAACGSSSSTPAPTGGTPAGTYTITITGSSGSASHNTRVTLIVN